MTDSRPRRRYVDWARALAILVMIEAHTVDAWTRPADRATIAFRDASVLGGFAAPLFLWLAGVALVLSATKVERRSGSRAAAVEAVCRRGLEIFVLAFLFRLQAFILSPGSEPLMLFRVDILNVMGPAIAAAAVVWGLNQTTRGRVIWCAAIAAAIGLLTPVVRAWPFLDRLPVLVQWYLRPAGEQTTFVLVPWAGFVFAGAAVGALVAASDDDRSEVRLQATLAAAGVALLAVGLYAATLPTIYRQSSFWTSSPTYFAIRLGVVMLMCAALFGTDRISHEITKSRNPNRMFRVFVANTVGAVWAQLAVRVLDSRRARVRLRELALARPAAVVGEPAWLGCAFDADVRRGPGERTGVEEVL